MSRLRHACVSRSCPWNRANGALEGQCPRQLFGVIVERAQPAKIAWLPSRPSVHSRPRPQHGDGDNARVEDEQVDEQGDVLIRLGAHQAAGEQSADHGHEGDAGRS
jgi:hypothetical protein